MIVGQEELTSGSLELGETVQISYVDQNREGLDPKKTLWEVVSDGLDYIKVGEAEIPSRAYVANLALRVPISKNLQGYFQEESAIVSTWRSP